MRAHILKYLKTTGCSDSIQKSMLTWVEASGLVSNDQIQFAEHIGVNSF